MSNTTESSNELSQVEWKNINWRKAERTVFKLQKRIYQASHRGNLKVVRQLQKTLIRSWYARLLAVRRVTQDNQGKKTAGVDGIKKLEPKTRYLHMELKASVEIG
jgi:RNA-directed DNA polymerase